MATPADDYVDLILVSGTRTLMDKCNVDLHIQLDRSPQLPQPLSANPWRKSKVSPLRDRLMIDWVYSHREAMKELHTILTGINDKLSQCKKSKGKSTRSKTVIVGLSCSTCLSICFVEKLYDYFSAFPPSDNFKVTRNHLNEPHKSTDEINWEHLPYIKKYYRQASELDNRKYVNSLTTSKDWQRLPPALSVSLEETFLKNPLSANSKIGEVQVDFVSGTLYNKTTGQKSYIRCSTQVKGMSISVRELKHETYKQYVSNYEAAGILPYSVHPLTREAIFLVGKLTYDGGSWCDFGGLKSRHIFRESPAQTAARECYEETLGVIGSSDHLLTSLRNYAENNAFKIVNENSLYIGHFLRIPFDHYPSQFATLVIEGLAGGKCIEVEAMRWLSLSAIRRANVSTMAGNDVVETYAINETDGSIDVSLTINLRIEFAYSLCIAEKFGVFDSIESVASKLHLKQSSKGSPEDLLIEQVMKISLETAQGSDKLEHRLIDQSIEPLNDHCQPKECSASKDFRSKTKSTTAKTRLYGMAAGRIIRPQL